MKRLPTKTQENVREAEVRPALHKALSHPLRWSIHIFLSEREASSKEMADEMGEDFHLVCEHVRKLRGWGYIEAVDEDTRSAGTRYRALIRPVFDAAEWDKVPPVVQEMTSRKIVRHVIKDIASSVRAKLFDSHPHRALLRLSIAVDEEGFSEADDAALAHIAELGRIEARSTNRRAVSGESATTLRTVTMVFPAGPADASE